MTRKPNPLHERAKKRHARPIVCVPPRIIALDEVADEQPVTADSPDDCCGVPMVRSPRGSGEPGHMMRCEHCQLIRVFTGDGREVNLATGGFKRRSEICSGECGCAGCGSLVKVKGLCAIHNSRWATIKLPRGGDTYRAWCVAGGPSKSKWEAMQ